MTEPNPSGDGKTPTVEALEKQIENLNQGIAKYRDDAGKTAKEASESKAAAAAATAKVAELEKLINEAKDPDEKPIVKLNPDDEKRLEQWAKDHNFVTKEELDKERTRLQADTIRNIETQAVDEFLRRFPQYSDEKEFAKIKEQFGLYKQPTSLTGYRNILNKIHGELKGDDDAAARARASIENRKRLALGGGGTGKDDSDLKAQMDDYREKYPHLSEETIVDRLTEINDLATARAKKKAAGKR